MYKFSADTLELFRLHQWRVGNHLDKMCADDVIEINRMRAKFRKDNEERSNCKECKEHIVTHGCVCAQHYHDYMNQGYECCWTCFVMTVCSEQLGIDLE